VPEQPPPGSRQQVDERRGQALLGHGLPGRGSSGHHRRQMGVGPQHPQVRGNLTGCGGVRAEHPDQVGQLSLRHGLALFLGQGAPAACGFTNRLTVVVSLTAAR
jgi:hypothetical protein